MQATDTTTHRRQQHHVVGVMNDSDSLLWTIGRDPVLRSPIVAVVVLDEAPDWGRFARRLERLTRQVPRLRSVARPRPAGFGAPRWVEADDFDLALHLRHVAVPEPRDLRTVLDIAQVMGSTAFDPELPLWEAVAFDGLAGDGAAVVIKVHHSVVDGVGGISVLGRLLDLAPTAAPAPRPRRRPPAHQAAGSFALPAPLAQAADLARRAAEQWVHDMTHPVDPLRRAQATAESVGRLLAPTPAPLSPLLTGRGIERRFDVLDVDLDRLRAAAAVEEGTINDAFVAATLAGLARYHERHATEARRLRVLMPINIRGRGDAEGGNRFVPARFTVDGTAVSPRQRIRHVHERAAAWKHAPALGLSDTLAAVLNHLPPQAATAMFGSMLKGLDFVVTNVPGPPVETWLAGAHVGALYAFGPTSGSAVNVALVTPGGRGCVGVNTDVAAAPDAQVMARCIAQGFDEILELAPRRSRAPRQARPAQRGPKVAR